MRSINRDRFLKMIYRQLGESGLKLPALSIFVSDNKMSSVSSHQKKELEDMAYKAFNNGIYFFQFENTPAKFLRPYMAHFGICLTQELAAYRDEILISVNAGHLANHPMGEYLSKKNIIISVENYLKQLKTPYIDLLYLDGKYGEYMMNEVMDALQLLLRQGKIMYFGLNDFPEDILQTTIETFQQENLMPVAVKYEYSKYRQLHPAFKETIDSLEVGMVSWSNDASQLILNQKVKNRKITSSSFLKTVESTKGNLGHKERLMELAAERKQTIDQMGIQWALRDPYLTSLSLKISDEDQVSEYIRSLSFTSLNSTYMDSIRYIISQAIQE